jgi:hypothetical protein
MIRASKAAGRKEFAGEGSQPTFHPVADDGTADFFGHGESDANGFVAIGAVTDQQNEARRRRTPAGVGRQEIGAFAKGD